MNLKLRIMYRAILIRYNNGELIEDVLASYPKLNEEEVQILKDELIEKSIMTLEEPAVDEEIMTTEELG